MHAAVGRGARATGWSGGRTLIAVVATAAAGCVSGCGTHSTSTTSAVSSAGVSSSAAPPELTAPHPAVVGGASLFVTDGCSACHSLDGTPGSGPPLAGASGQPPTLDDGHPVPSTSAFLREALLDPARNPVKGYPRDLMALGVARLHLSAHPKDVDALVAFLESAQ